MNWSQGGPSGSGRPGAHGNGMKMARRLALQIEEEILTAGYAPGHFLGNEPELIARFDVSRAVFREATRIVEADRVAVMRRGAAGGLYAAAPDSDAVTHALSIFLRYRATDVADLYEARLTVESQCASLAATNMIASAEGAVRLKAVIAQEQIAVDNADHEAFMSSVVEFHATIAELSENAFYGVVVRSLLELTEHLSPWAHQRPDGMSEAHHAHVRIGDAVLSGDQTLASARMRRHLHGSREFNTRHRVDGER